ncbi:MAG: NAD-binding protein [Clostridia bacterium]|nr:NAD-binding protein [Clostridia bacterium]
MIIVVMGGGKVGESLTRRIMEDQHELTLIETDRDRCVRLANELDIEVICGDGTDVRVLETAGVGDADCFIAVSGNDADNIVASQLAKNHFGAKKVVARANDPRNMEMMHVLGVDYAVSSTEIIARIIEQEANLMEFHLVASLNKGKGQILSVKLEANTALEGRMVKDIVFPKGSLLISVVRREKLIIPSGTTVLQGGDEIIAVCEEKAAGSLLKLLHEEKAAQ